MRCRSPTNFLRWREWSVQFEWRSAVPAKLRCLITNATEPLQVKWAAHLPYAVATALLKETLPVDQAISTAGLRNRVWAVGQELDDKAESAIRGERAYPPANSECKIVALAVDSAWLRHRPSREEQDEAKLSQYFPSKRPPPTGRHVNIIAGRAVRDDGCCKVYGYVNREVTSAATRLDHFLSEQGTALDQKITIVSDGAGEFEKAVNGSKRPLTRILDWFHIAIKFRAIEQSALKFSDLLAPNVRTVQDEIASAKWLTWHGKGAEAVERIKSIHDMLGYARTSGVLSTMVESSRDVLVLGIE